jgi:hypothetical protein
VICGHSVLWFRTIDSGDHSEGARPVSVGLLSRPDVVAVEIDVRNECEFDVTLRLVRYIQSTELFPCMSDFKYQAKSITGT